jgi:ribosomal protein S12 methylthiotransferase
MNKTVHFIQLGCDKNRVDGEVMLGLLNEAGYEMVAEAENAGAIIVNTCGFIREAVQESIEHVLEAAAQKANGACKALIVAGCMAARYKDEILNEIPEADAFVNVADYSKIVTVLEDALRKNGADWLTETKPEQADNDPLTGADMDGARWNELRLAGRKLTGMPHIAYVKIAEGCDNSCTYCTIPSIRGGYAERPFELIVDECKRLADDGAKELVLVAQDSARYSRIADLLRALSQIDGVAWIRLMYAYPEHITDELIDALASGDKICRYIDMPIQHASDGVLKRMGRRGTKAGLIDVITRLRENIPGIALRTTLIVGFPGETEEEYNELVEFVKAVRFDRLGVFAYSREDGTPAAKMKRQVKQAEAAARRDKLMLLQQEIHREKQQAFIGKDITVMVDKAAENAEDERPDYPAPLRWVGRTSRDAIEADAVVTFTAKPGAAIKPGDLVTVHVTAADEYDLRGEMR